MSGRLPSTVRTGGDRGEICWADLGPYRTQEQTGRRPVIVWQSDTLTRLLHGGDHAFGMPDGTSTVTALFADLLDWMLDPKKSTGTAVVK